MRRVTHHELEFYDGLAHRLNRLLGDPACVLTQSSLASRIGWHRASLCNFLNRIDKTIAAHFIPKIAQTFHLSIDELMGGGATVAAEPTSWDPRMDEPDILVEKLREWRDLNLPNIQLHGHLPPVLLPRRGMVANYVDSLFGGGFPEAAERWHDLIDAHASSIAEQGEGDVVHLISHRDLLRLPNREYPFDGFSKDDVVFALEALKKNWVRQRGLVLIAIPDNALTPEAKVELSSLTCLRVVGRETRIEYGNDFRVRWSESAEAASMTSECLLRLKKLAGFGARERPTTRQVEELIDSLLLQLDDVRIPVPASRNSIAWTEHLTAA